MKQLIVIGAGMAGFWAAVSAARARKLFVKTADLKITLINQYPYHSLRPCNYEEDLERFIYPLEQIMDIINVTCVIATVTEIDPIAKQVITSAGRYAYDGLVLAAGSHLNCPVQWQDQPIVFDVDTYESANKLNQHITVLHQNTHAGRFTAVVVGAGFTGLEIASELPVRIKKVAKLIGAEVEVRVILVDSNEIGHTLGEDPRSTIVSALQELQVEMRSNVKLLNIDSAGIVLADGSRIDAQTVVWTAGLFASSLTKCFDLPLTAQGQIAVNQYLQIDSYPLHYAVGDVAHAKVDDRHYALMSCQHARPQGRFAGYNVVAELYGQSMLAYQQIPYVTCLDLGPWGAIYTEGWQREVELAGAEAKKIKMYINHERICPPAVLSEQTLFAAADPTIQLPPGPSAQ